MVFISIAGPVGYQGHSLSSLFQVIVTSLSVYVSRHYRAKENTKLICGATVHGFYLFADGFNNTLIFDDLRL